MLCVLAFLAVSACIAKAANVTADATSACMEIHSNISDYMAFDPLGANALLSVNQAITYTEIQTSYWDAANEADRPACIVFPANAEHVSVAVKILNKYTTVPFAIKSGGHQFNRAFSSTNGGVLISFRPNLASTELSADGTTAKVGPGSKWIEAIDVLDPSNKIVVGGRIGDVGVGGYILGGGLAYHSAQYGFAADNVENFEAVLANGTIVNANNNTNTELYWALRGGGNAFAIVTMYTLKTHDTGDVWGGILVVSGNRSEEVASAITNFIANNDDPRAAVIPTKVLLGPSNLVNVFSLFLFYDGPTPPSSPFADFLAIDSILDTTKTQRYKDLVNVPSDLLSIRTVSAVNTFPNLPHDNMTSFLSWHFDQASNSRFVTSAKELDIQLFTMAMQPIPVSLQQAAASTGPSPMHPDPQYGDKVWIEYDIGWQNAAYDDTAPTDLQSLIDDAKAYEKGAYGGIEPTHYVSGDLSFGAYNPLFMNDAMSTQDVLSSYGEANYQRLKTFHANVDPDNFFTSRQKGWFFNS